MGGRNSGRGTRVAVVGGLIAVWWGTALGAAAVADGFASTGQAYADWYWISRGSHARWEFTTLPPTFDSYLGLEAFLCLPIVNRPPPPEIEVRFRIDTGVQSAYRLYVVRLGRTVVGDHHALYFGQAFLSRRELGVGSRLIVSLDGSQTEVPLGVHASSIQVRVAGGPAPTVAVAPPAGGAGGVSTAMVQEQARTLPISAHPETAPFLAPGAYRGELGWAGPYTAPIGRGVYKVNLRAGQIITLRVETGSWCTLTLHDPTGRKVGEVEGSSWLGLEYRVAVGGAWQIVVACHVGGPLFPYILTVGIH